MKTISSKRYCHDTIVHRKSRLNMQNKRNSTKAMKTKCRRLKEKMEEIGREQKIIKEAQSQVGEKMKAIEMECELLQKETKLIIRQSFLTQLRLALMINVVKAREEGDFAKAALITQLLREIIARDNMQRSNRGGTND